MENPISLKELKENEPLLKKHIFTTLQLKVLKKKIKQQKLNSNEKTYYYKFIKPKVKALLAFSNREESIICGKEFIIPERIIQARKLLQQMQRKYKTAKILISGSFLFNQEFRDIDVFVFTKYHKEDYHWKKVQVSFLPESALNSLFFSSLCQISLSNFVPEAQKEFTISLKETLQTYELLVNEIINKEDYQIKLREFLLQIEYLSKRLILNPQQLYFLRKKFTQHKIPLLLQRYLAENLALSYSKTELSLLKVYLKDYQKLSKEYKESANLHNYIHAYREALELAS